MELVFYIVAVILFVIASLPSPPPRVPWVNIGLAFFAAAHIIAELVQRLEDRG